MEISLILKITGCLLTGVACFILWIGSRSERRRTPLGMEWHTELKKHAQRLWIAETRRKAIDKRNKKRKYDGDPR